MRVTAMAIGCRIVAYILASRARGEDPPAWVRRHLERCPACEAEVEAWASQAALLAQSAEPAEACPVGWDALRSRLEQAAPVAAPKRVRPAYAMSLALLLLAAGTLSAVWYSRKSTPEPRTQVHVVREAPAPPPVQKPVMDGPKSTPGVPRTGEVRPPKIERNSAPPVRRAPVLPPRKRYYARHTGPAPEREVVVKKPDQAPPPAAERERVAVVAAEEHVIDVVGIDTGQPEAEDYVITRVSFVDDDAGLRVDL